MNFHFALLISIIFALAGPCTMAQSYFKSEPLKTSLSVGFSAPVSVRKSGFDAAYSPCVQINMTKFATKKISLHTGIGLYGNGVRKTVPYFKYETYSVALPLTIQYELVDNFNIELGYQHQISLFERYAVINGKKKSGKSATLNPSSNGSVGYVLSGIKFRLNDFLDLSIRYGYALKKTTDFNLNLDSTSNYSGSFKNHQAQILLTYTLPDMAHPKTEKQVAELLIKNLKSGALMVILPHTDSVIKNNTAQKEFYKTLMQEAAKQYTFSKIYFFGYNHLAQVSNHTYAGYLNNEAEITQDILPADLNVLIATIGLKQNDNLISDIIVRDSENLKISPPFPFLFENNNAESLKNSGLFIFSKMETAFQKLYSKTAK